MISLQVYVVVYLQSGRDPEIHAFKNGEHAHRYCARIRFRPDYKYTDEVWYTATELEDTFEEGKNESGHGEIPF